MHSETSALGVKKNIINKILIPTILIFGMLNIGITNA
jgi:hypothetical protein